ncbi:MAG: hypothetical protein IKG82_15120 [Oscillospiraceae bacterium]|nr:hypothetical protein [Oscillospiraceae bacterium]
MKTENRTLTVSEAVSVFFQQLSGVDRAFPRDADYSVYCIIRQTRRGRAFDFGCAVLTGSQFECLTADCTDTPVKGRPVSDKHRQYSPQKVSKPDAGLYPRIQEDIKSKQN